MRDRPQHTPLLVTGSNGRLGGLIRAALAESGRNLSGPASTGPVIFAARRAPADLILHGDGPLPDLPRSDVLLALWGCTSGNPSRASGNAALAHRSRAVARACGATLVLHLSSAAVYGAGADLHETQPLHPAGAYGCSKRQMEREISGFDDPGLQHVCLRLANVVGADSLAPALAAQGTVTLDRFVDDRGPVRSYIAPGDLARVIAALAALPPRALPDVINVAAPTPVAMADLARASARPISWRPAPHGAVPEVSLNTDRLRSLLPAAKLHSTAAGMIADWRRTRDMT